MIQRAVLAYKWTDWGLIFSEALVSESKIRKKALLELNI